MPIGRLPLLGHVVGRLSTLRNSAMVVVATGSDRPDDVIEQWCVHEGVLCFRGSEKDVLDRYFRCANHYALDPIVRLTADNPFTDIPELDRLVDLHLSQGNDFTHSFASLPVGVGAEIFNFDALACSWRDGRAPHHREHVDEYMLANPALFKTGVLAAPASKRRPEVRLTVDTPEDYVRACFVAENARGPWAGTEEAIDLCSRFA